MNTICPSCKFDLRNYPVTIELDSHNRSVYCPACSTTVEEAIREIPQKYIFFDDEAQQFVKWVTPKLASAQKEIVEDLAPLGRLNLRLRTSTRDFKGIFYERVLVFVVNGEITLNQVYSSPENHRRYGIKINSAKLQSNENWIDVGFTLKGGFSDTAAIRALVTKSKPSTPTPTPTDSALIVWPNFKRPEWEHESRKYVAWSDYFVYFATQDPNLVNLKSLRIVGEKPQIVTSFADVTRPMGAVNFPPEYIEITADVGRGGGVPEEFTACFRFELKGLTTQGSTASPMLQLSVDFGTSNTCFYHRLAGKDPKALKLSDKSLILVGGLELEDDLRHTWMPAWKDQTLLPSELVFRKEPHEVFNEGRAINPIVDYTIPPLKWRKGEEQRISTGFKWEQATEPELVKGRHLELQKMFLGLAFRLVMAELVSGDSLLGSGQVHPGQVDLTVTYPLSMTEKKFNDLYESFRYVRDQIEKSTGISLQNLTTIDESRAGEQGTHYATAGEKIYIDIGGGTTDISVIEQDRKQGRRTPLIVDSMRYAGNDFLTALTGNGKREGLSNRPLIELQRRIRVEGEVLSDVATFGNIAPRQEAAQKALDRFLDGIIQYIARVIAYRIERMGPRKAPKLIIYLLGNGWRFALFAPRDPLANPDTNPRDVIREAVKARLDKELERFRKGGILAFEPTIELQHPEDPKTVVARGALLIEKGSDDQVTKLEPESFVGSDIKVVTSTEERDLHWNQPIPSDLKSLANNVYINNSLANFEELIVPDYQHTGAPLTKIQDVNIKTALHERGRIVKNAFNYYLETWHKKYLTGNWQ